MLNVTKTQAISYLKKGFAVTVHRDKVAPNNPLSIGASKVSLNDLLNFENLYVEYSMSYNNKIKLRFNRFVNTFEYYNSESELGSKTCYSIDN
jgi:hypothetical protein